MSSLRRRPAFLRAADGEHMVASHFLPAAAEATPTPRPPPAERRKVQKTQGGCVRGLSLSL